jgi:heat shock protein HtpX
LVGAVGIRAPGEDKTPLEPAAENINRAREVSDMMYKLDNYKVIDCDCGTRLKIPPSLHGRAIKCPHCGRTHQA